MTASTAETARRIWERCGGNATSPEDVGAAAQRLCDELRVGLSRWVGAEGYRVLLDRSLVLSVTAHPVLNSFSCHDGEVLAAVAAARTHGTTQLASGVVTVVATLTDLLGRIIGEEIAMQLVERAGSPQVGSSTDVQRGRHG